METIADFSIFFFRICILFPFSEFPLMALSRITQSVLFWLEYNL
jgi:hypothetical protein